MKSLIYIAFAVVVALVLGFVLFQNTNCFEIHSSEADTRQILLDKCTGDTWMLARSPIERDGDLTGEWTFSWQPLIYGDDMLTLSKTEK